MRITRRSAAVLAATAAIGIGAIPALAQDDGVTESTEAATEPTAGASSKEERRAEREAAFAEALAEELGLDTDTVAAALATVREQLQAEHAAAHAAALQERLDEAVANGDLTQEEADAIAAAHEAGVLRGPGRRGGHGPRGGGPGGFVPRADGDA